MTKINIFDELMELAEKLVGECICPSTFVSEGKEYRYNEFDYIYFTTSSPAVTLAEFLFERTGSNIDPIELARVVWLFLPRDEAETPLGPTFRGMDIIE